MEARHFEPVLKYDSQTVAVPEAEHGQSACDGRYLRTPGRIAEPPFAVGDRRRVGAALHRSKKGPTQIKHRKTIICRRRAEASGRFRSSAALAATKPDRLDGIVEVGLGRHREICLDRHRALS